MPIDPEDLLDPDQNDDIDDDGELDVEWYPLPDYLQDDEEEDASATSPSVCFRKSWFPAGWGRFSGFV